MEFKPDLVAEWPTFSDHPISGAAASLHVSDRDVEGGAWRAIGDGSLVGDRYFAAFITSEADTPFHRARPFWKQHSGLSSLGETWEESHASDNTITRVALLELKDSEDIRDALYSTVVPSRQRLLVVTGDFIDIEAFARLLVADPALSEARFRPRGMMPWLLRAGMSLGVLVVAPEDDSTGRPGLGFYGNGEQINRLRSALLALPTLEP